MQGGVAEQESDLIARAARGDAASFRALYEANADDVYAFLCRRVDAHTAEDLTADTFCRAYERLDTFEWRGTPLRAWLLKIAYHLLVARSRRRDAATLPIATVPEATGASDAEREALADLEATQLREAMALLSEEHRVVLELRYLRDLSSRETGVVLGITDEAVRARTYRALKALRVAHLGSPPVAAGVSAPEVEAEA